MKPMPLSSPVSLSLGRRTDTTVPASAKCVSRAALTARQARHSCSSQTAGGRSSPSRALGLLHRVHAPACPSLKRLLPHASTYGVDSGHQPWEVHT